MLCLIEISPVGKGKVKSLQVDKQTTEASNDQRRTLIKAQRIPSLAISITCWVVCYFV